MCGKTKSCSVCLKSQVNLIKGSDTDGSNIRWTFKLTFCVPEVKWNNDCFLCHFCTDQLHAAYSFRSLCLQSNKANVQFTNLETYHNEGDHDLKSNDTKHEQTKMQIDYTCYYCNKKFITKLALIKHIQFHMKNRCGFCETQFTTNTQLQLHNAQKHHEISDKLIKSPISLNLHVRQIHESEKDSGKGNPISDLASVKIECTDLKTEENSNLKLNDYVNNTCFSPEYKFDCNSSTNFISNNSGSQLEQKKLKTEIRSTRRVRFYCEECDDSFTSSKKLLHHALDSHGFDSSVVKPFRCDKCDSKFSTSSNLLQHKKYHMGKRTHICTFCGKGYITKSDLNTHEKQHLNKREYHCTGCPKTFNTNKDLRSHKLVVHTDSSLWNYVCTFCQKRFPIKSNLDQHMRRHTGEKRFGCHICDKRFVDKIVLQKHIKSHSNFRAFKCEHCNKEYKDGKVLEVHLTKVHGIGNAKIPIRVKKYFCHVCPKSYFAKNKLTRHVFSHTGEKPYVCHVCDRKFTDKSYVKQHLKTTHNVFEVEENSV